MGFGRKVGEVADHGARVAQSVGDAGGSDRYIELAPWTDPPRGSIPLFLTGFQTTTGVVGEVITPAALVRTMRRNEMGIIRGFTMNLTNMVAATRVDWRLVIGGVPVDGLNPVTIVPGVVTRISRPLSVLVFVPPTQRVEVQITNNDGGIYSVGADIEGWTYQLAEGSKMIAREPDGDLEDYMPDLEGIDLANANAWR